MSVQAEGAPQRGWSARLIGLGLAVALIAIDQASKWYVLEALELRERFRIEVGPILTLVLAYNTGVNFGLFASNSPWQPVALAGFAIAISAALAVWSVRADDWRVSLGCGFVIGGAVSNAIDRLIEGAVIDFINLDCCGIGNPFAFNLADCAIFLGAGMIALYAWREETPAERDDAV